MFFSRSHIMYVKKASISLSFLFNFMILGGLLSSFIETPPSNDVSMAYLDPGTGSMIISAIIGIFATIALGLKTFWYKIVRIFKADKKGSSPSTTHQDNNKK